MDSRRLMLGRRWAAIAAIAAAAALAMLATPAVGRADTGPVPSENALPGTPGWYMPTAPVGSAADQYAGRVTSIDGWIWPLSAAPGERVDLHVGTVSGVRYRVEFYRLGWYGGAGARLISCLPSCSGDQAGVSQPLPPAPDPATGMVRTSWSITDSLTVPAGWPSGTYMAALRITSGTGAGTVRRLPFVIRAAAPNTSKIVVVVPVNTWAAYNGWGGKSLYDNHSVDGVRASVVSFEKPWADGVEIQNWRYDEYPLVRFLERQDLDVSYITDWDVSSRPGVLAGHRVVVTMGHGEYWTKEHRDALEGGPRRRPEPRLPGGEPRLLAGALQRRWAQPHRLQVQRRPHRRPGAQDRPVPQRRPSRVPADRGAVQQHQLAARHQRRHVRRQRLPRGPLVRRQRVRGRGLGDRFPGV